MTFQPSCLGCTASGYYSPKGFNMNYFGRFSRVACVGAILALAANLVLAAPQPGSAKVAKVSGVVYLGSAPANVGDVVGPGTVITTGPASEVLLNLGANGGYTRVLENSKLSLDELTVDAAGPETVVKTRLGLKEGKIDSQVGKLSSQSSYVVQTPSSTAAIRGTIFTTYANGAVLVFDGCVDVVMVDPVTKREARYSVCKGQMFDPKIPGVVSIPPNYPAPTFVIGPGVLTPSLERPAVYVSPFPPELSPTEPTGAAAAAK